MIRIRNILAGAVVLAALLTACGSDGGTDSTDASRPDTSRPDTSRPDTSRSDTFVLQEWAVVAPTTPIEAGSVRITAVNEGSEAHELVIVRADAAASLPTKADGSVDEDAIPEADMPGEIPDVAAGDSANATLDLPAGDYVAFCNLVDEMGPNGTSGSGMGGMGGSGSGMGHVHFQLGMSVAFTVT